MSSVAFCTLGCKVNQYETDAMEELFAAAGYEIHSFKEKADIYIVNTCSVTNIADHKSRQMLHQARKRNPDALVVAVGCYVQAAQESLKADHSVDLLVGNRRKADIVKIVEDFQKDRRNSVNRKQTDGVSFVSEKQADRTPFTSGKQTGKASSISGKQVFASASAVSDISRDRTYENLHVSHPSEHTRAYIKIQDGCNQFCSYCLIPYARGRVCSRPLPDILSEAKHLVSCGYQEIVLTGIHISSYGLDFVDQEYNQHRQNTYLIQLVEELSQVEHLKRIRLGSLEPGVITEDFASRLSKMNNICPHFHISMQSGCDQTLVRMNRHYTTKEYDSCCQILRRYFDQPALTTDVIVGFPGETEEEFEETRNFIEHIGFSQLHVFQYSKREGTKAANMEGQVSEQEKGARSAKLIDLGHRLWAEYVESLEGREVEILLEKRVQIQGISYMEGRTREYLKAVICGDDLVENTLVRGRILSKLNQDTVICERID